MKYNLESDTGKTILERVYSTELELFKKYLNEIRSFRFPELDGLHWTESIHFGSLYNERHLKVFEKGLVELVNSNNRIIGIEFDEKGYSVNKKERKGKEDIYFSFYNIVDETYNYPVIDGKEVEIVYYYGNDVISIKGKTLDGAKYQNRTIYDYVMSIYTNIPKYSFHLPEVEKSLEPEFVYRCYEDQDISFLRWECAEGNGVFSISTKRFKNLYDLRLVGNKVMNELYQSINVFKR